MKLSSFDKFLEPQCCMNNIVHSDWNCGEGVAVRVHPDSERLEQLDRF